MLMHAHTGKVVVCSLIHSHGQFIRNHDTYTIS